MKFKILNLIFILSISVIQLKAQTHTFCALDMNCTWSGNQTFNGTTTLNGFNNKTISGIRFADQFSGIDACGKIAMAITDLPASGGTIDARGFEGAQACTTDMLAGNTKNITILFGNTTISSSASWGSTSTGVVRITGNGYKPGTAATVLNFTGATAGIVPGSNSWELRDLYIKGNNSTSTDGLALGSLIGISSLRAWNVAWLNWNNGINITQNSIDNMFYNCEFSSNRQYGIRIAGTVGSGNFPTTTHFIGGRTQANLVAGTYIGLARGIRFDNFLHNGNSGAGVSGVILGGAVSEEVIQITFNQNWFEGNGGSIGDWDIKAQRVRDLKIIDNIFASSATTPIEIFHNPNIGASDADHVIIENNTFLGSSNPVILDNNVQGSAQGVQLRNNEGLVLTDNSGVDTQLTDRNIFKASKLSAVPMAIQGAASQTANLLEFRNSVGTVSSSIDGNGQPIIGNGTLASTRFFLNGPAAASYNGIQIQTAGANEWYIGRNGTGSDESLIFRNALAVDQVKLTQNGFISFGTITVGGLPTAAAGNAGQMIKVSDSTFITTEGQQCAGASTVTALAFSNGTIWKCF